MSLSHKTRIGVLRGGPSPEYEVSLDTGKNILANLPQDCEPVDVFISKEGIWHEKGFEKTPGQILRRLDLVLNGLHGKYGEDGEVQKILDHFGVPYSGPRALPAALSINKIISKKIYKERSLKTPYSAALSLEQTTRSAVREVYENLMRPFVVKPSSAGSSIGVYTANSLTDLEDAVLAAFRYSPTVLIEEYVRGREATCGVIDGFRREEHYVLLPVEIRRSHIFDYDSKYSDHGAEELCPGNFSEREVREIEHMAKEAHKALGLRHYSRSDFIIHPKRGIFILETNSLPGLTERSLIPRSLQAVGSNLKEFLSHIISKTLGRS